MSFEPRPPPSTARPSRRREATPDGVPRRRTRSTLRRDHLRLVAGGAPIRRRAQMAKDAAPRDLARRVFRLTAAGIAGFVAIVAFFIL